MTRALHMAYWHPPILAAALALAGCDSGEGSGLSCSTAAPLPAGGIVAVDTSQTPRENRAAEILALEASGEFVAPTALYERVASDLGTLRSQWPDQTHSAVVGCGAEQIIVGMTDAGIQKVESGQYTAWNDYNQALHVTNARPFIVGAVVTFGGIFNFPTLARAYRELPEVTYVEPDGLLGGSADVCLERGGDTHVYIFWTGSGDCPAGCTGNTYHGFATTAAGGVSQLGRYDGHGARPGWFADARSCRAFLYNQP